MMNQAAKSTQEILTDIQHALTDVVGGDFSKVSLQTPLASLGVDSIRALELTAHFEDRLGLILSDGMFSGAKTVGDLTQVLKRELDKIQAVA